MCRLISFLISIFLLTKKIIRFCKQYLQAVFICRHYIKNKFFVGRFYITYFLFFILFSHHDRILFYSRIRKFTLIRY